MSDLAESPYGYEILTDVQLLAIYDWVDAIPLSKAKKVLTTLIV